MRSTGTALAIPVLLWIVLLLHPVSITAQKDTIGLIRRIFEEYRYPTEWSSNKQVYHLSCTVKTIMRGSPAANVSNIEILVGKEQTHFISRETEIYRDATCSYWVDHKRKSIMITAMPYSNNASLQHSSSLGVVQDELFGYCSVRSTNEIQGAKGEKLQSVVLDLNEKGRKKFGVHSVAVIMDPKRMILNQVNTVFTDANKIERIETVYHKLDKSYATDRLSKSLPSYLKNTYKDYFIDDLRNVNTPK